MFHIPYPHFPEPPVAPKRITQLQGHAWTDGERVFPTKAQAEKVLGAEALQRAIDRNCDCHGWGVFSSGVYGLAFANHKEEKTAGVLASLDRLGFKVVPKDG